MNIAHPVNLSYEFLSPFRYRISRRFNFETLGLKKGLELLINLGPHSNAKIVTFWMRLCHEGTICGSHVKTGIPADYIPHCTIDPRQLMGHVDWKDFASAGIAEAAKPDFRITKNKRILYVSFCLTHQRTCYTRKFIFRICLDHSAIA